ncbi:MAG: glycoside hydrolase family 16 protein [Actinomycetia bacterium]|nr:glycoside hydrolase family 16 protein [Actinomycetes bacterium]
MLKCCRAPWRALVLAPAVVAGLVGIASPASSVSSVPLATAATAVAYPQGTAARSIEEVANRAGQERPAVSTGTVEPVMTSAAGSSAAAASPAPTGAGTPTSPATTASGPVRGDSSTNAPEPGPQAAAASSAPQPFVTSGAGLRAGKDLVDQQPLPVVEQQPAEPVPPVAGSWRLVYADEFNGSSLDPAVWMKLRGLGEGYRWPYNVDIDGSAFDPGYTSVENGSLRVRWAPEPITDGGVRFPYTAGVATTATGFSFQHGVIEARIWLPRAAGITPAFWLLPTPVDSTWPPEVDIAEFSTTSQGRVDAHFNIHYRQGSELGQIPGFPTYGKDLGGSWHTYTLDWRPNSMTMLLDGKVAYRYTGPGIPQQPMYILFSGGVQRGAQPGPGHMLVDYVRVWQ